MASSIRAGRFLGQNRPDAAKTAARVGLVVNGKLYIYVYLCLSSVRNSPGKVTCPGGKQVEKVVCSP